jgi:hypothetical protein
MLLRTENQEGVTYYSVVPDPQDASNLYGNLIGRGSKSHFVMWSEVATIGHPLVERGTSLYREIEEAKKSRIVFPCECLARLPGRWCSTHQASYGRISSELGFCVNAPEPVDVLPYPFELLEDGGSLRMWFHSISGKLRIQHYLEGRLDYEELFRAVVLKTKSHSYGVTPPIAYARAMAIKERIPQEYLECPHCGQPHDDLGEFATSPHKVHICGKCGKDFSTRTSTIGNTLIKFPQFFGFDSFSLHADPALK